MGDGEVFLGKSSFSFGIKPPPSPFLSLLALCSITSLWCSSSSLESLSCISSPSFPHPHVSLSLSCLMLILFSLSPSTSIFLLAPSFPFSVSLSLYPSLLFMFPLSLALPLFVLRLCLSIFLCMDALVPSVLVSIRSSVYLSPLPLMFSFFWFVLSIYRERSLLLGRMLDDDKIFNFLLALWIRYVTLFLSRCFWHGSQGWKSKP